MPAATLTLLVLRSLPQTTVPRLGATHQGKANIRPERGSTREKKKKGNRKKKKPERTLVSG